MPEVSDDVVAHVRAICDELPEATDWTEVAELIAESYRLNAPKRLRA